MKKRKVHKLDLLDAYLKLDLDDSSKGILVINAYKSSLVLYCSSMAAASFGLHTLLAQVSSLRFPVSNMPSSSDNGEHTADPNFYLSFYLAPLGCILSKVVRIHRLIKASDGVTPVLRCSVILYLTSKYLIFFIVVPSSSFVFRTAHFNMSTNRSSCPFD